VAGAPSGERPLARLRVGFAGTPPFAAAALEAILVAGAPVELVLTQPDRPSGRGMSVVPSAVKTLALAHGLPVLQPATLKTDAARAPLLDVALDVLVVAAYGLLLPPAILAWPRHGCLNIHASLLPRWRGAAPIQHAILAGDATTGVTIMQMDAGLDTGPMIATHPVTIGPHDTGGSLTGRLAETGAEAIVQVLTRLATEGGLPAIPQPAEGATYAGKVGRADAQLDWTRSAAELDRVVRAFDPVPGAATALGTEPVKVWSARSAPAIAASTAGADRPALPGAVAPPSPVGANPPSAPPAATPPGMVVAVGADGIDVACGDGLLRLVTVQPAGGKRMSGAAFAAGRAVVPGTRFGVEG